MNRVEIYNNWRDPLDYHAGTRRSRHLFWCAYRINDEYGYLTRVEIDPILYYIFVRDGPKGIYYRKNANTVGWHMTFWIIEGYTDWIEIYCNYYMADSSYEYRLYFYTNMDKYNQIGQNYSNGLIISTPVELYKFAAKTAGWHILHCKWYYNKLWGQIDTYAPATIAAYPLSFDIKNVVTRDAHTLIRTNRVSTFVATVDKPQGKGAITNLIIRGNFQVIHTDGRGKEVSGNLMRPMKCM